MTSTSTVGREYTDEVLELAPERTTRFLAAVGALPEVRTLLFRAGMTSDDIKEGRELLLKCLAAPMVAEEEVDTEDARRQREAVAEIDQADESLYARAQAALKRHYPSAASYVFRDLKAGQGSASVQGMATFLARLSALEKGTDPGRGATGKEDAKAVKLLAQRGITAEERKRLQGLVDLALGPTAPLAAPAARALDPEARTQKLAALRAWFDDWSQTARAVVRKRAHLIRLGLASRRSPSTADDAESETGASSTSTPATA